MQTLFMTLIMKSSLWDLYKSLELETPTYSGEARRTYTLRSPGSGARQSAAHRIDAQWVPRVVPVACAEEGGGQRGAATTLCTCRSP